MIFGELNYKNKKIRRKCNYFNFTIFIVRINDLKIIMFIQLLYSNIDLRRNFKDRIEENSHFFACLNFFLSKVKQLEKELMSNILKQFQFT